MPIRILRHTAGGTNEINSANPDRRTHLRFPVDADLWYRISGQKIRGTGQVENISSNALAFRTEGLLQPGMLLSASVAWRATLDGCKKPRFVFEGVVLRAGNGLVVTTIERPQFRSSQEEAV